MTIRVATVRVSMPLLVCLVAGPALGQHERLGDRPGTARSWGTSLPFTSDADGFSVTQVNVTPAGQNITGDAANEPSLAIDPTAPNRLVIGWRQFDTVASNFRQAGYAWSNDGGRSWNFEGVITPGVFRSDPVLETDSTGNFYYYTLPSSSPGGWRCELFKSTDGGREWTGPVLANGGDRAWFTIDKRGGIGDGNIYAMWNPSFSCCPGSFGRDLTAGMSSWPPAIAIPNTPIWGTIAVGPDGEVYLGGGTGTIRVTRSDTARDPNLVPAFNTPVVVNMGGSTATGVASNPGGASGQTWIDVNSGPGPRRGHVYLVSLINPPGDDPADVHFSRSADGGQTWSPHVRVNADLPGAASIQWFPSMSVAPNGRIDVTYNSTHESGNPSASRFYYTFSENEGDTWSAPEALSPAWNSTVGWPNQNKIGDYYDQQSDDVGLSIAMSATMNGEQDVYFIRVNDRDCNQNGVGDVLDLGLGVLHDCDANEVPDECEIAAGAKPDVNNNGIPDGCECYADCNGDGTLNLGDFGCFQTRFALALPYADCNGDGTLNLGDFGCFQTKFALGCP